MITTLTGANSMQITVELKRIRSDFIAEFGDFAVEQLDASEVSYQQLLDAVQTLPFLATKRLIIIDSPSANKDLAERCNDFLTLVPPTSDVVFVEAKFDKRSSIYKTLQKLTDFRDFAELNEAQVVTWIVDCAKGQGAHISTANARLLVQRVGVVQQRLQHEVEKLAAYAPNITKESIELLVSASSQSSTFDLLDAALTGQTQRALALYEDQRCQRVEPQAILALLSWQLHVLAIVKAGADRSADQIARDAKLNPYVVRKTSTLAKKLSMTRIHELIRITTQLDTRLKREPLNADVALQNLVVSIGQI